MTLLPEGLFHFRCIVSIWYSGCECRSLTCPYNGDVGKQILSYSLQVRRLGHTRGTQRTAVLCRERHKSVFHYHLSQVEVKVLGGSRTCRAEEEDRRFPQELVHLIGYGDLSVGERREGLAVGLTQGVIDVIEQDGEGLAAEI